MTAGPRVQIEVGGARLSKGKLRKLLPIYAEGAVDDDLLQEGRRNIRDFFQREGYFDADVQVSSHEDAQKGERVISYEISRGDRFRLAEITFDGNKYFSSDLLSGRLQLQPASFASSGRFSQQLVRDDTDSIRALYISNGFRDAQVTPVVDNDHKGKKGNLLVTFHVVEGPQTRVASLEIKGNQTHQHRCASLPSSAPPPASHIRKPTLRATETTFWRCITTKVFPRLTFRKRLHRRMLRTR